MPKPTVEAVGLSQLRRDFKAMERPDLLDILKDTNRKVGLLVIAAADAEASTPLEKRSALTLEASKSQKAAVRYGRGFEGAFGGEFGAIRNIPRQGPSGRWYHGYNQFQSWRGNDSKAGYFLWPAIRREMPIIIEAYVEELQRRFGSSNV